MRHTLPSLHKHILRPLRHQDLFFFGHFPAGLGSQAAFLLPFHDFIHERSEPDLTDFFSQAPVGHDVESRAWTTTDPLLGYLRQLRSIHQVDQLQRTWAAQQGITFDWVLRLRFDNLYVVPIEPLEQLRRDVLYVPAHDSWGGLNDRFAIASPDLMAIYANRFNVIAEYLREGLLIHPETLLAEHLARHHVSTGHTRVVHHLYRHGHLWKACFKPGEGDDPSYAPPQPGMRWRFQIKMRIGEAAYQRLALLWWRLGI
ncbi:hypothetical protein [Cyanobium sp. CH-040]|uniref:DUF7796 domain-containing protein n=1 Tax=Cyanobium sp. CH-040 TaxID=2823708 RepID=UPI0020CC1759|nr:hypothetical protein [Cyanobium sp. CH-040]MCP9927907.1 hypothetical protein [Cyanobium sp. CH-040]